MHRPKENERKDIQAEVLSAAKHLFVHEGYKNITMRRIAKEVGCTPAAIYLYFDNKEEILFQLHNEGFKLLFSYKQRAVENGLGSALERLKNGGMMYIAFALENPEFYELMFNMPEPRDYMEAARQNGTKKKGGPQEDYAMRSYEFLRQGVVACQAEGYLPGVDPDIAAFNFWASAHGIVSLIIRKRVPYPQEPSLELAERSLDFFMDALRLSKEVAPKK